MDVRVIGQVPESDRRVYGRNSRIEAFASWHGRRERKRGKGKRRPRGPIGTSALAIMKIARREGIERERRAGEANRGRKEGRKEGILEEERREGREQSLRSSTR